MLYLLGDGDGDFLKMSTFFPRPIPGFGDFPIAEGML